MYRDALGLNSLRGLRMRKTVRPFLGAAISKMPCVFKSKNKQQISETTFSSAVFWENRSSIFEALNKQLTLEHSGLRCAGPCRCGFFQYRTVV